MVWKRMMKERVILNHIEGLNTAIPHTKAPFQPYVLSATSTECDQNWTALALLRTLARIVF